MTRERVAAAVGTDPSTPLESSYVVRGEASPVAIADSLRALLPARQHSITRQRYTELDTFDGRVRRAGARLTRSGRNGSSTLSFRPRGGGSHLAVRLAEAVSFAWDLPEGPLQQALAPVIGVRRLLAQADAEEHGSLLEILDDRGKTVARLRIESGRVRRSSSREAWQLLPSVITLSSLRGYEGAYERLVPVIESRPGIEPCPDGLRGELLRQAGVLERGDVSSPRVDLAPTIRADEGARQIHLALLGILAINEPGLRANLDTEFLHDFRVALRRTRSLLGQIRHVFPVAAGEQFATELSWVGRLTGPPRDLDVLVLELRAHREEMPAGDIEALMTFLGRAQDRDHQALVEALDSDRYRRLLSEWEAFLQRSEPAGPEERNAGRGLAEVVARRAWRLSRRIADTASVVDEHTTPTRLHEVRIAAKKLRYLVDVTPSFYDAADLERILGALKKLQRVLGDFNDAHVQEARLIDCGHALGAAGGPTGAVLALGRLAERCRQRREGLRPQIVEALARFRADETQSACRRAFKTARALERTR